MNNVLDDVIDGRQTSRMIYRLFPRTGPADPAFSDLLHPDWTSGLQDAFRPNPKTLWAKAPDAPRTLPTESSSSKRTHERAAN